MAKINNKKKKRNKSKLSQLVQNEKIKNENLKLKEIRKTDVEEIYGYTYIDAEKAFLNITPYCNDATFIIFLFPFL